ncbi:hypothetical protein [Marinigracilibium pacificum]|uniref:Uncharacterized protein n=1 Tax=Marinigracilibium pacificum TaxID=2729599 RepID=A0A848J5F2_9BACT|nr:hypothetical protein [Marinigracilibium pacificum]NMM49589.1 hypothetical protein [Marinigracilibium pacificum]
MKKYAKIGLGFLLFILFATFMRHVNTKDTEEKFASPQIGDYYVFENLMRNEGQTGSNFYKIKDIDEEYIYFYKPIIYWPLHPNLDRDMYSKAKGFDENEEMFSKNVIRVSHENIIRFRKNNSFSASTNNPSGIRLLQVYRD